MPTLPRKAVKAGRPDGIGSFTKGRKSPLSGAESRALYAPREWPFGVPKPTGEDIEKWAAVDYAKIVYGDLHRGRRKIAAKKKCGTCFSVPASGTGSCYCGEVSLSAMRKAEVEK